MMIRFPSKLIIVSTLATVLALTSACSSKPETPAVPKTIVATAPDPYAETQSLIKRARKEKGTRADEQLILAATQLVQLGRPQEAESLLAEMENSQLTQTQQADRLLVLAQIAFNQQKYNHATELLTSDKHGLSGITDHLDTPRLNRISLLRAQTWEAQDNFLAAARERIFISPMLDGEDTRQENLHLIWQNLTQLPTETLESLNQTATDPELGGWLKLALIYKGQQDDIDGQMQAIRDWQYEHPNHPAAQQPPDSIRILAELHNIKPQRIALLLPTEGKFRQSALAIQNGFLAAYYSAANKQNPSASNIEIRLYDSSDITRFIETYQQAVTDGADIIVGPLQKENVHQLAASPQALPVTTIALNTDDLSNDPPVNLFQFGLTPEEDAREVAQQALRDRHQKAAVFYQQGPWGERSLAAFREAFSGDEQSINAIGQFDSAQGYANAIKSLLHVTPGNPRNKKSGKQDDEARRRQDIDFLYLIATPEQARMIKPLLNFYFAENLPVYTSSQIYGGEPNPDKDRDLNNILFCDLPWILDTSNNLRRKFLQAWPKSSPRFYRLNALGVDAYRLQARIQMLKQAPGSSLYGATGTLSIGEGNRIQRTQTWAQFQNGRAVPIPQTINATFMEDDEYQTTDGETEEGKLR